MATLLSVNGLRIQLAPNRSYSIGRGIECDISIQDMGASRHHACLRTGSRSDPILLEDLGSRNGTFVDEVQVDGRRPLPDLSRIRIGATHFLLCLDDGTTPDDADADTRSAGVRSLAPGTDLDKNLFSAAVQHGQSSTRFAGQLSSPSCIHVLQLLIQRKCTGTLCVVTERDEAQVHLQDGEIVHAVIRDLEGFDALVEVAVQNEGLFWLLDLLPNVRRTITVSSSVIILQLCRARDEKTIPIAEPSSEPMQSEDTPRRTAE